MNGAIVRRGVASWLSLSVVAGVWAVAAPAEAAVSAPARVQVVSTADDAARLAPARAVLASRGAVTVSVIGDSIGNDPGEWVSMWADDLATDRYVFVHHFDATRQEFTQDVEVHAPSSSPRAEPVTVWNFGWPGGTPQRALDHLSQGVPTTPDLAVISFGQNLSPGQVQRQYAALDAGMRARFGAVPTVTSLAPMTPIARAGQAQGRVELVQWLRSRGLAFIDERGVYDSVDDPDTMMWDSVHPNVYGYRRIADLVTAQLSPKGAVAQRCSAPSPVRSTATLGRAAVVQFARGSQLTSTLRATDTCGLPLANAWVKVSYTPTRGTASVVVSTQTDRHGTAVVTANLPSGFIGSASGFVTDGTTTVQIPTGPVTIAR